MGFDFPVHQDWQDKPNASEFQQMWRTDHFADRFVSYIVGRGIDGKRYCRTVEAMGRDMENEGRAAQKRLDRVWSIVAGDTPSRWCTAIDGGDTPRESDQPIIQ